MIQIPCWISCLHKMEVGGGAGQRNGLSHNNGVTLGSDQKEWKCIKGAHLTGTGIYQSGDKSSTSKDIR